MIDFVVLPYKRASQSGVVPMAFSFGKTVIATNVGALSEQIPQGTGIVVEPNSTLIAESIDKLYSTPNLILDYNKNAKKYADTELSWEHSADLFHNILDQLIV
jgi:glycosyltransferase involved in cell wall biosynthesis